MTGPHSRSRVDASTSRGFGRGFGESGRVEVGWRREGNELGPPGRFACAACLRSGAFCGKSSLIRFFQPNGFARFQKSPCCRPSLYQRHGGATGQRGTRQGMQDLIIWVVRATAAPRRKLQQSASRIRAGPIQMRALSASLAPKHPPPQRGCSNQHRGLRLARLRIAAERL